MQLRWQVLLHEGYTLTIFRFSTDLIQVLLNRRIGYFRIQIQFFRGKKIDSICIQSIIVRKIVVHKSILYLR